MRKIILPVLLLLTVFLSLNAYSQPGMTCANAYDIPLDESCPISPFPGDPPNSIPPDPIATGNRVYCTSTPNVANGKLVWVKFRPTNISQCVRITIDARTESGTHYPTEVAFYTDCAGAVNTTGSMCFADGKGIWSPPASFAFSNQDYYLRIYVFYNGAERILVETCGKQYVPENDDCLDASPIPVFAPPASEGIQDDNVCGQTDTQERDAIYAGNTDARMICAQTLQNTSWYQFTVNGTGSSTINISGVECDTYNNAAGNFIQAGLVRLKPGRGCNDPYNSAGAGSGSPFMSVTYTGAAPPLAPGMNRSPATAACTNLPLGAVNSANLTTQSLPAGTVVFLAIDGYDGANCKYTISGLSNIVPIPISLKDFIVWKKANVNLITWTTVWEMDNDYFDIERSSDGVNFTTIGTVNGSNNSNLTMGYSFEDKEPLLISYYRLKQVDNDGKFTYGKIVMIRRETSKSLLSATLANPVYSNSKLIIDSRRGGSTNIRIMSSAGENLNSQMLNLMPGRSTILKDFSKLTAGTYYLVVTQGDEKIVKPFVKQ